MQYVCGQVVLLRNFILGYESELLNIDYKVGASIEMSWKPLHLKCSKISRLTHFEEKKPKKVVDCSQLLCLCLVSY